MRKFLLSSVVLLSGCVSDTTVYKHYPVAAPTEKASLFVEKPSNYRDDWDWNFKMSMSSAFQGTFQKYFMKTDERNADFILRQTYYKDNTSGGSMTWAFFSGFTLGILPMWAEGKATLSYSLTDTQNKRTVQLSDVPTKGRFFFGWLMMPAILFPGVHFLDDDVEGRAFASAMEEAASLIYNKNSKLYQIPAQKKWGTPIGEPTQEKAPAQTAVPTPAPAKEPNPEEMDAVW